MTFPLKVAVLGSDSIAFVIATYVADKVVEKVQKNVVCTKLTR